MSGEHDDRRIRHSARKICHQIAAVPAQCLASLILMDSAPKTNQALCQKIPDFPLPMGWAGNPDQFQEFLQNAFLINHCHKKLPFNYYSSKCRTKTKALHAAGLFSIVYSLVAGTRSTAV